jgi:hypothetical protein
MAVGAPNFALRNLRLKTGKTAAATRQLGHAAALDPDVVKVQEDEPPLAAIRALRLHQQLANVDHVSTLATREPGTVIQALGPQAPGTCAGSSSQPMAIHADDVAFCEFLL